MRIVVSGSFVLLLMRDRSYVEVSCPSKEVAQNLATIIELGIADVIEQIQTEGAEGAGPFSRH